MRFAVLITVFLGLPVAAQEPPVPRDPPASGEVRSPIELGPGGWPILREPADPATGGTAPRSDFAAERSWSALPAAPGGAAADPAGVGTAVRVPGSVPPPLSSPLRDVFKAVHQPADLASLGGVTLVLRLTLFDHRGEELGSRDLTHEADLAHPDRDRLMFTDGRVYGRLGDAVYAERHRRPWPTLDGEARDELQLMGVLLRTPWVFAEGRRFVVFPVEYDTWRGEDLVRLPIERRPHRDPVLGPRRNPAPVDRFELLFEPNTFMPRQLVFRLASTGVTRRVLLQDYRALGGVRIPWRRTFLVEEDRVAMVMKVLSVEIGQRFGEQHFRPQLR